MIYKSKTMKSIILLSSAWLFLSLSLPAQPALFTSDASIGANDTNYDGEDIVVVGCTVTIDGSHSFSDVLIIENGTVTHSPITNLSGGGFNLSVSNNVVIEAGSAIDAGGLGFGPGLGAGAGSSASNEIPFGFYYASGGGGGFGGCGGSSLGGAAGGGSYGPMVVPNMAGSGGGAGFGHGGAGGGQINLTIGGALVLDGQISANGAAGLNVASGGGSGGSVSITAPSVSGAGSISANGGVGENSDGGGGGGGRIALFFTTNDFTGTVSAAGGQGAVAGGAGTVDLQSESGFGDQIVVDNGGASGTNTPLVNPPNLCSLRISGGAIAYFPGSAATFSNMVVGSNSWLVTGPEWLVVQVTVLSNAVIQPGGGISMNAVVTTPVGNPGGVYRANGYTFGGGGGGGGNGGNGLGAAGGAAVQGSVSQPVSLGSIGGMGAGASSHNAGGAGGGAFVMNVKGTLTLNGSITANGGPGVGDGSGGGAGGSVHLTAGTLAGAGAISAGGGAAGSAEGGGGGGGRIAVNSTTNQFSGSVSAAGGFGLVNGGAGTIFLSSITNATPLLLLDNGGASGAGTPLGNGILSSKFDLTVTNGATLLQTAGLIGSLRNLVVGSNSFLIQSNQGLAELTVSSNATVAAGGGIIAAAYSTGSTSPEECGGSYGGYGGAGPAGLSSAAGGSLQQPASNGERGGSGPSEVTGGTGGGALKMNVTGTLLLNGSLTANGLSAAFGSGAGGGSGGSIYLTAARFAGIGLISANGGAGNLPTGGGGAGGRIAIYASSNTFAGKLSAYGAPGYAGGGAGTIYVATNSSSSGQVIVDNGGLIGTNTPLSSLPNCDLAVANGAVAAVGEEVNIRNLLVGSNGFIVTSPSESSGAMELFVSSNASILPTGGIILDGEGFLAGSGEYPGATSTSNSITTGGGGGGLAGCGGNSAFGSKGGGSYPQYVFFGNLEAGNGVGSGGGAGNGSGPRGLGGAGGGNLLLTVTGALTLGGNLSANGATGPGEGSGGGGGGGIWVKAGTLAGNGTMTANGGAGQLPYGGGGGGGVVQVISTNNQFTGTMSAYGGAGAAAGGAGAIYEQFGQNPAAMRQVIIDNGGQSGTNTPFAGAGGIYDLKVVNGAIVALSQNLQSGPRNLSIGSNSFMVGAATSRANPFLLSISGNATILPTGGMVFDGDGSYNNSGQGAGRSAGSEAGASGSGGGYGGSGGASASGAPGGGAYGGFNSPASTGSGGGSVTSPVNVGGLGGGALELTVTGTLALGGNISANGTAGVTQSCGGGSGGSVWLKVEILTGGGSISANGGAGQFPGGGGGGGGRIAVIAPNNQFTGLMSAQGGAGFANGGAGTVYIAANSQSSGAQLILNNGGLHGPLTPLALPSSVNLVIQGGAAVAGLTGATTISSLLIASNSFLFQTNPALMNLVVTKNATVQAGGGIILDGSGYGLGDAGSGSSTLSALGYVTGGGGGHGGCGGSGQSGAAGGNSYDVFTSPNMPGSGGGAGAGVAATSARGGGALELTVTGTLRMDGLISANGAVPTNEAGGGGSGGGIYVNTGVLAGAGSFSANGASGDLPNGGGGGGGRIALRYSTNLFTGALLARGGPGFVAGGAGAISLAGSSGAPSALIIDNGGLSGANTPISAPAPYDLTISGGAVVVPQFPGNNLTIDSLLVASNAVLTQASAGRVYFTVLSNALVQSNASISADGLGYNASQRGPGAGTVASNGVGSGGGHGGMGGAGASGAPGGATYDSSQEPALWGSAGGVGSTLDTNLSQGGGAIELTVGGTFTVNGNVSANGNAAVFPGAGGGAGGSLFLTLGALTGNGQIRADGGAGRGGLGGGGGGRIALFFQTNQFAGTMTVSGGAGFASGQSGTLWLATNLNSPIAIAQSPVLLSAVAGLPGGNLSVRWSGSGEATCQLQSSPDLVHWQPSANAIISISGTNTLTLPVGRDPGTFFRLVPAP